MKFPKIRKSLVISKIFSYKAVLLYLLLLIAYALIRPVTFVNVDKLTEKYDCAIKEITPNPKYKEMLKPLIEECKASIKGNYRALQLLKCEHIDPAPNNNVYLGIPKNIESWTTKVDGCTRDAGYRFTRTLKVFIFQPIFIKMYSYVRANR